LEKRKIYSLIAIIIGIMVAILNIVVIYPHINCAYAPFVFWLIALLGIVGGLIIYFDVKIFHSEES